MTVGRDSFGIADFRYSVLIPNTKLLRKAIWVTLLHQHEHSLLVVEESIDDIATRVVNDRAYSLKVWRK